MKAIVLKGHGGRDMLTLGDIPQPQPQPEQLLIRVHASALNRADILQRKGHYPAPEGDSEILGLEIAGDVVAWGDSVEGFKPGQRVFGLVGGGGYSEYCLLDHKMAMLIPERLSYEQAAAVPEAFFTANETVIRLGELKAGERILIHAGASGVGSAAVQLAKQVGAEVYFTASSQEKIQWVMTLGAMVGINYKSEDFVERIMTLTDQQGVDVIEDFVGADYFLKNLQVLKPQGRLIQVGLMGGSRCEIDLGLLLMKRLQIKGSAMRNQSLSEKRQITARFYGQWYAALEKGIIKPLIDSVYTLDDVALAHEHMESNLNCGKIVLKM